MYKSGIFNCFICSGFLLLRACCIYQLSSGAPRTPAWQTLVRVNGAVKVQDSYIKKQQHIPSTWYDSPQVNGDSCAISEECTRHGSPRRFWFNSVEDNYATDFLESFPLWSKAFQEERAKWSWSEYKKWNVKWLQGSEVSCLDLMPSYQEANRTSFYNK